MLAHGRSLLIGARGTPAEPLTACELGNVAQVMETFGFFALLGGYCADAGTDAPASRARASRAR
jgi:hypothetical protein